MDEVPDRGPRIQTHLIVLVGLIGLLPMLVQQAGRLWQLPYMRFFPVAWVVFAFYCYRVPKLGFAADKTRRRVGVASISLGLFFGLLAAVFLSPNMAHFGGNLLITGWVLIWLGIVPWTRLVALTSVLWLAWPLPRNWTGQAVAWIQAKAISSTSHILDLVALPHFAMPTTVDLRSQRLDVSGLASGADSFLSLGMLTLLLLIYTRRPLLIGLAAIFSVPVIGWMGAVVQLLMEAWALESLAENWSSGWQLLTLRCVLFIVQCGLVSLVIYGLSYALEPVAVNSTEQSPNSLQAIYNRLALWPMNPVVSVSEDERDYFADEEQAPHLRAGSPRKLPKYRETATASDPWLKSKLCWPVYGVSAGAFLLGLLGLFLPPQESELPPEVIEGRSASISHLADLPLELPPLNSLGGQRLDGVDGVDRERIAWHYSAREGGAQVLLEFPTLGFIKRWQTLGDTWSLTAPPRRIEVVNDQGKAWPMFEVAYAGENGALAYGWYSAFDERAEPVVPSQSFAASVGRRLTNTVFNRLVTTQSEPVTYQLELFLQTNQLLAERRKRSWQKLLAQASDQLVASLQEARQEP